MIVRIMTEAQYTVSEDGITRLNELDNEAVAAVEAGDEAKFADLFGQMLDYVRTEGTLLGDEELEESDVMIPPPDLTFEEAKNEFTGEGLIPD